MIRRRLVALAALLAVAFGALWPLVSAAKPGSPAIPSFICTQSGAAPHAPAPGGDASDDFHCPLCIATADFVAASNLPTHVPALRVQGVERAPPAEAAHDLFPARPPPSRAPPPLS